jgi:hypothetical protein
MLSKLFPGLRLTALQWTWFVAIAAFQIANAIVLPMFNGADERGHYARLWALSDGHFGCTTLPASVIATERMNQVAPTDTIPRYFERGMQIAADDKRVDGWDYLCHYFPSGMVVPALVNRFTAKHLDGTMRRGGAFAGAYAARLAGALVVDVALLFLLCSLPWGRYTALAFFSIPSVVYQSSSIGHDGFLFVLTVLILVVVLQPPSWRGVFAIAGMATLMTLVKPTFAPFGLLGLPHVARLYASEGPFRLRQWLKSATMLAPTAVYALWRAVSVDANRVWMPGFSHPKQQLLLLAQRPWRVFGVFIGYFHYFIDDHRRPDFFPRMINGKWTTIFFANAYFEMSIVGTCCVMAGLILALVADIYATPRTDPPPPPSRLLRWAWGGAIAGVLATFPLTIIALYLIFSHVGADYPYGVQGRYHLFAMFLLLMLGVLRARHRVRVTRAWMPWLALAGAILVLVGNGYALEAIYEHYWPHQPL